MLKLTGRRTIEELDKLTQLNIGCGYNAPDQFLNLDINEGMKADVISDARTLPFPDERFDFVYSSDCLEHISHRDTHATLNEWIRVLKKGGTIKIQVPNLWAAFESLKNKDYGTAICVLYGAQDYKENFHFMGYTPEHLRGLLESRNIKITDEIVGGNHMILTGVKQ